jgi:4-amino-4-deoxy-L-arabinose transferase-like glycosyltransferase
LSVVGKAERITDCLWIVACGAVLALVVHPFQNLPFIDDWTYAWSVDRLLTHGELRILEWSTSANLAQVLWGALFCLPFGFSFSALRVSTSVLAVGGLCSFYLLLRELDVGRREALLGAATLGLNPIFFMLSFTFMTDVPFLAVMTACAAAMVRGIRRESSAWLIVAIILGSIAFAVRNVGIAIPAAVAATLILDRRNRGRRQALVFATVVPLSFLAAVLWWTSGHTERTADIADLRDAPATRLHNLRYMLPLLPTALVTEFTAVTSVVGAALLPLSVACTAWKRLPQTVLLGCIAAGFFAAARLMGVPSQIPLSNDSIWSLTELGLTAPMVPDFQAPPLPWWWPSISVAVAVGSFAIFLAPLCARPRLRSGETFLLCLLVAHLALIAVFWLAHDRYLLVLLPPAIALLLCRTDGIRPTVPALLLALFALVSLVGLHDHLSYNRALWHGVDVLRRAGARDSEIDGGYVVSGWLQYAHPENAPRDVRGNPVIPHLTDEVSLRYRISSESLPGWEPLATIAVDRWLGPKETLYVLEDPS